MISEEVCVYHPWGIQLCCQRVSHHFLERVTPEKRHQSQARVGSQLI